MRAAIASMATIATFEGVNENDHLVVTRTDVPLPHWPREADGLKIGQLSDFHADYEHAVQRVARAAEMLIAEKPDLVIITGDYVSDHTTTRRFIAPTVEAQSVLARVPRGAFAIMGNHDYWGGNVNIATHYLRHRAFKC